MKTIYTKIGNIRNKSVNKLTEAVTAFTCQNANKFAKNGYSTRVRN